MLGNGRRRCIGVVQFRVAHQFLMLLHHVPLALDRSGKLAADRAENLAVAHPEIDGVAIIVPVIHQSMKLKIEVGMLRLIREALFFDLLLQIFQTLDPGLGGDVHEAAGQGRFDQHFYLTDILHEIFVDRPDARTPIGVCFIK